MMKSNFRTEIPKVVAEKLWTPNVHLANCKACDDYLTDPSNQRFTLYAHFKSIEIKLKKIYRFTCNIDLSNYPFDAQQCKIRIEKYGSKIRVPFDKNFFRDISTNDVHIPPEFSLTGIKWKNCTERDREWMECVEYIFHFRRMIANHVMLVFIPSMLIVILSWISFWLDVEVAAPRVALGLTSLLTLATQLNNSQRNLPPVSDVKAVDIWMFACMFIVFGSLIEFAVANFWVRRKKNSTKVAPETKVNSIMKYSPPNIPRSTIGQQIFIAKKKSSVQSNTKHSSPIDFVARIAFPVTFVIFNVIFWGYFATKYQ